MMLQSGENVVAVLPYGFGDNDRRVGMDLHENIHAHALVIDEAVFQIVAVRVRAAQREALGTQGFCQLLFHLGLRRPADLVCGLAQVAAGDQQNFAGEGNGCNFSEGDSRTGTA
jgi:hypothetical protein